MVAAVSKTTCLVTDVFAIHRTTEETVSPVSNQFWFWCIYNVSITYKNDFISKHLCEYVAMCKFDNVNCENYRKKGPSVDLGASVNCLSTKNYLLNYVMLFNILLCVVVL